MRHCKPGYWGTTKKPESECRVLSTGRQGNKQQQGQGKQGCRTSQGEEDDVSESVFPLLGPVWLR